MTLLKSGGGDNAPPKFLSGGGNGLPPRPDTAYDGVNPQRGGGGGWVGWKTPSPPIVYAPFIIDEWLTHISRF